MAENKIKMESLGDEWTIAVHPKFEEMLNHKPMAPAKLPDTLVKLQESTIVAPFVEDRAVMEVVVTQSDGLRFIFEYSEAVLVEGGIDLRFKLKRMLGPEDKDEQSPFTTITISSEEVKEPPRRQVKEVVEKVFIGQETTDRYGIEVPIPEPGFFTGHPVNSAEFLKPFRDMKTTTIEHETLPMPDVLVQDGVVTEPCWVRKKRQIDNLPEKTKEEIRNNLAKLEKKDNG